MNPADLMAVILACAPGVAPMTVQSIIDVESRGNELAIGVNRGGRLSRQPANAVEAAATARSLLARGVNFDAGLMQINSANWSRLGLTPETVFHPCTNIRAGAKILTENYSSAVQRHGAGRPALLVALSLYNTGRERAGFANGYVAKVNNAAAKRAGRPLPVAAPLPAGATTPTTFRAEPATPHDWNNATSWGENAVAQSIPQSNFKEAF